MNENSSHQDLEQYAANEGLDKTRDKILRAVSYTFSIIVLPALFISVKESLEGDKFFEAFLYVAIYTTWIVFGVILFKKIPYRARSTLILGLLFIAGAFILAQRGLSGGGTMFLVTFCVMSTALLGLKTGLLAIAVSLLTIGSVGMAMVSNLLPFDPVMVWNSTSAISWSVACAVFLVLSVCMVWSSGILQKRLLEDQDEILRQNTKLINEINRREELEREKEEMERRLSHSQKLESIGNLAGGIAHDFNNILSSIIGYTELVLEEIEKESTTEDYLKEVYTAGMRAKDLVSQILAFARQSEEEIKPLQVNPIAEEVLNFIRSSTPTTIEIRQSINSNSLIMGNPTQVHQVLMNLFTNATYAMEASGGVLAVNIEDVTIDQTSVMYKEGLKPGNYVEIKVSDTGTGIPKDIVGSIFDPYFTTKGPGEGTGMGLAMVNGIVESYGGKINVDTQLGKGTIFKIYLPVTKSRSVKGVSAPEQLPTGTERILFVDDEDPIAKMGSQTLEHLGYSVTPRTSSIEALELFRTKPDDFDLVVTDMTMPNMTGDKLAVELMKIRPDIPVILCTGYSKKISDETALDIGIKAFAYKPVVKADLAKTVRKVLDEAKA